MADVKLERMRQLMREEEERKNGNRQMLSGDRATYPYWNIPEKQTAVLRFLPDKDIDNPWFWVEKQTIKLPFEGVVGGENPTTNAVTVAVPCIDMFGDTCPIIAETRGWWKTNEALARKYWKKRSYIAQGFVVASPFEESNPPENPIRRFFFGTSVLEKLKAGLMDQEMENAPTDFLLGTDFKIKKTRKGDYNNYDTSEWSRRSRPLSEAEQIALDQYGLFNLKDFIGPRPDAQGVEIIKALFRASVAGEAFDMASWGAVYRPFGASREAPDGADDYSSASSNTGAEYRSSQSEPQSETNRDDSVAPHDLMSQIRQRQAQTNRASH